MTVFKLKEYLTQNKIQKTFGKTKKYISLNVKGKKLIKNNEL